jgi:uncharacterized membrane protein YfcA
MLGPPTIAALAALVLVAFTVEAALGFGATVVTVALGAFLAPIDAVLPAFVPLNVVLSAYLVGRYRRDVDRRLLFRRVAPFMGLGLPFGLLLFRSLGSARLTLALGVFVVILAAVELLRRGGKAGGPPPGKLVGPLLLVAAGVIHGMFATGGPLAVYVVGRELRDKARFRATLSALWLALNVVLVATYAASGKLGGSTLLVSAALAPGLAGGLVVGEWAHRRVPEHVFERLVFALLLCAGALLSARSLGR